MSRGLTDLTSKHASLHQSDSQMKAKLVIKSNQNVNNFDWSLIWIAGPNSVPYGYQNRSHFRSSAEVFWIRWSNDQFETESWYVIVMGRDQNLYEMSMNVNSCFTIFENQESFDMKLLVFLWIEAQKQVLLIRRLS